MSRDYEPEDLAAFGVLEELAHAGGREDTAPVNPVAGEGEDEAVEVLRRLYLESLGLLAYELDPVAPRTETKAAILTAISGDETQEVPSLPAPPKPLAEPVAKPAGQTPVLRPAMPARAEAASPFRSASGAHEVPAPRRLPLALAILFALAAIGLGVWAASLASEVAYRDAQIRGLESRLAESQKDTSELARTQEELTRVEERLTFVTAPAVTVFALRPPASGSPQPLARGHLFVAANRHDWRLEVRGLKQEPEAQDYQLWFIVDGLPMSGGVFDARSGRTAVLADHTLPAGIEAVALTLERKGGVPSPTSPILLIADRSVQL